MFLIVLYHSNEMKKYNIKFYITHKNLTKYNLMLEDFQETL